MAPAGVDVEREDAGMRLGERFSVDEEGLGWAIYTTTTERPVQVVLGLWWRPIVWWTAAIIPEWGIPMFHYTRWGIVEVRLMNPQFRAILQRKLQERIGDAVERLRKALESL